MIKSGKSTGSRCSDGDAPNVNWNDGKMKVNWNYSDNRNDNLRSRQKFLKKKFQFIGTSLYSDYLDILSIRLSF